MSLKAKIILGVAAVILALAIVAIVVWAVNRTSDSLTGTIKFEDTNVHAQVSGEFVGMDSNPTLPALIFSEGDDASSQEDIDKWADTALSFANSNTSIQLEITVENLSEKLLYVKIDDKAGEIADLTKSVVLNSQDALGKYVEVPGYSSITYTITLSLIEQSKVADGECEYLITLLDQRKIENTLVNIQAAANQIELGSVSDDGVYELGETVTLTARRSGSNSFLAWTTSLDPNTMEILSTSSTYSFELSQGSPRTYYALFNQTSTNQTIGDLSYTFYNEAKLASVTDAEESISGNFTIPSVVTSESNDKFKIFSIGEWAFMTCDGLTSITIPEGVTSIGERAFANCSNLTSVTIPEGITKIGTSAFIMCHSLEFLYGPGNSYYFIDNNRALVIDGGKTLIAYAVANSESSYSIPEEVTTISSDVFYNCNSLTTITIPEGVTSIGNSAFQFCGNLTTVIFEGESQLTSIGYDAFSVCSSLISIVIPESVTNIGSRAFGPCNSLAEITINGNVSNLDSNTFQNCSNLVKLTFGANVTNIPSGLFANNNLLNLTEIVVEAGSTLSEALPTYGTWVKDGGSTVTNFFGAGTYTRTDV